MTNSLTLAKLEAMKKDVAELYGWIKSSHRCEALGRALGFTTWAATRAAASAGTQITQFYPRRFVSFLQERGWPVDDSYMQPLTEVVCDRLNVDEEGTPCPAHT